MARYLPLEMARYLPLEMARSLLSMARRFLITQKAKTKYLGLFANQPPNELTNHAQVAFIEMPRSLLSLFTLLSLDSSYFSYRRAA